MSLDLFVAANAKKIPHSQQLATAIREAGFTTVIDPNFDTSKSCGYVPCPDATAGFEYTVGPLTADELTHIGISPEHHDQFIAYDSILGFHFKTEGDFEVVQAVSSGKKYGVRLDFWASAPVFTAISSLTAPKSSILSGRQLSCRAGARASTEGAG